MSARERIGMGRQWFNPGLRGHHWFYEYGMPGWARTGGGYPCLHIADMHFPDTFDRDQEMQLLKQEAKELERTLEDIRERITELEAGEKT